MIEPTYGSFGEFSEKYGISRNDLSRYITLGVIKPRRSQHGTAELSETDMVKIAQYNTEQREKKTRLTGR